jgi:malate dehydrogenase (oxaloacetate-decarboxylating)(NADP+)
MDAYVQRLQQFVYHSGTFMKPVFTAARKAPPERSRIIFAEGEEERILRAAQILVDEGIACPTLVGRPAIIESRLQRYGLRLKPGKDLIIVNPEHDVRYREYWEEYRSIMARRGITAQYAKLEMRRRTTLIASMLLRKGEGDGMICGTISTTIRHLRYIDDVIGLAPGATVYAAMNAVLLPGRQVFIADTHVNLDPTAAQIAEITFRAAAAVRSFGIEPKVALLSHSNFGTSDAPSALKMRRARELIEAQSPDFEFDGEMHGDSALSETLRKGALPESTLTGSANLLVMPNLDAANISYNLLKTSAGNNVAIGPILLGCAAPVNILTASATVRRIVNVTALTVASANAHEARK